MNETLVNLAAIVVTASPGNASSEPSAAALEAFSELRVYHPRPQDKPALSRQLHPAYSRVERIEFVPAVLCRPELLVEIEGVANLG